MKVLFASLLVLVVAAAAAVQFSAQAGAGPTSAPAGADNEPVPPIGPPRRALPAERTAPAPPPADRPLLGLAAEPVVTGLDNPLLVTAPPGDPRLFIVEKAGRVQVVEGGRLLDTPFLDLTDVVLSDGAEQGLLGLAFHPQYRWNGRFFVYYTDHQGDTRLVQYRAGVVDPNRADPGSGRELLFLDQPQSFHQAGMMIFGPDGYLWMSSGDGGGIGDQYGHAQDPHTLFGVLLRLDVDSAFPYAIPPDNPFVATGEGAPEVWAYGLRNPWRWSIDTAENRIYVADVGQFRWEEVSVVPLNAGGLNFGWSVREGTHCYEAETCAAEGMVMPVLEYDHRRGCAVIGGDVYRGTEIPELWGHYFFGDWCGQWVQSFRYVDGAVVDVRDWTDELGRLGQVLSLGTDAAGEIYVATGDGVVYKLVARR